MTFLHDTPAGTGQCIGLYRSTSARTASVTLV